jgi:group I intron endonuclease
MIGIYKITNPNGKIYIGQSIDIKNRFIKYKCLDCKKQVRLYRSFNKYGIDNHKFDILLECNTSELNDKERYYQDLYQCVGKNGLNCILTSSSDKSGARSEETKLKISNTLKGHKVSEETKMKLSMANIGKKHTEESKLKMSKVQKGSKHSEEAKLKISLWHKGKVQSEEARLKMSLSRKGVKWSEEARAKRAENRLKRLNSNE